MAEVKQARYNQRLAAYRDRVRPLIDRWTNDNWHRIDDPERSDFTLRAHHAYLNARLGDQVGIYERRGWREFIRVQCRRLASWLDPVPGLGQVRRWLRRQARV